MMNDYPCNCGFCAYHIALSIYEKYENRLTKLETENFTDWSARIDALQAGLNNVYDQFKELQSETGLETILQLTEGLKTELRKMKSFDAMLLEKMHNFSLSKDDYQDQINHIRDRNFENSREIDSLKLKINHGEKST